MQNCKKFSKQAVRKHVGQLKVEEGLQKSMKICSSRIDCKGARKQKQGGFALHEAEHASTQRRGGEAALTLQHTGVVTLPDGITDGCQKSVTTTDERPEGDLTVEMTGTASCLSDVTDKGSTDLLRPQPLSH